MKSTSEQQNTETRAKPDAKLRLACLANSSNRKGTKSFKEGNYTISIIDDIEFYQARKCLEARSERLKKSKAKERNQTQLKHFVRNTFTLGFRKSDKVLALRRNKNITRRFFCRMQDANLAAGETLSKYKISKLQRGKCFGKYLRIRFCIRKLVRKM